jgi:hypothetical protein
MTTGDTYALEAGLGLDYWAAATFFGVYGITVSTLSGLVRDGKDAPLRLYAFQRSFLRWLEPRLSRAHCAAALQSDIARCKTALTLMGVTPCSQP